VIHDPFVPGYQGDLLAMAEGCDAVVIMVKHDAYGEIDWAALSAAHRPPPAAPGAPAARPNRLMAQGWSYRGVGMNHG
jgi:UDP-N-acetyl-D-mannosaminuronic acid dehydrogenase